MSDEPTWVRRFTAPTIEQIAWAPGAPERVAAVTTEDGSFQAWSWDLGTGARSRASLGGVGAEEVHLLPDGSGVVWWYDELGDERGRWLVTPFGGSSAEPLVPGVPDGWMSGISLTDHGVAVGIATDEDYRVYVGRPGEEPAERYRHERPAGVGSEWPQGRGGLAPDGSLLCLHHAERGDIDHPALRVLDAATGETLGDQVDPDLRLEAGAWAPVAGDHRLAFTQERAGIDRPAVWDLGSGERADLTLDDLEGPVVAVGWTPDAARLVAHHDPGGGVQRLLAIEPATAGVGVLVTVDGTIHEAGFRPDGALWYRTDSSA
ncbi:MAG TPA: hypothetical protein VFQ40_09820, partial [Actinomycetota bacterium]|nr:hypothetical protein [Actinomycetota bacterium]